MKKVMYSTTNTYWELKFDVYCMVLLKFGPLAVGFKLLYVNAANGKPTLSSSKLHFCTSGECV